jgi:hypothetical protein
LFVDANAVKIPPVAVRSFESVPRRRPKVSENSSSIDHIELPENYWHNVGRQRS